MSLRAVYKHRLKRQNLSLACYLYLTRSLSRSLSPSPPRRQFREKEHKIALLELPNDEQLGMLEIEASDLQRRQGEGASTIWIIKVKSIKAAIKMLKKLNGLSVTAEFLKGSSERMRQSYLDYRRARRARRARAAADDSL